MIIFFYGPDGYRLRQAKNEVIAKYKSKYQSGMNLFHIDFYDNTDTADLENAFKAASFFNEHKLIVCQNVFQRKTTADKLYQLVTEDKIAESKDITLFVAESAAEKEMSAKHLDLLNILLSNESLVKDYKLLDGTELFSWVRSKFKGRGAIISAPAVKNLISIVGNDTWALANEIAKLTTYKNGGEVTAKDIDTLVASKIDMNIFDLVDAVGSKNKLKATELLYRELKTGRDPYYVLTMIIYQFRNIMIIKDLYDRGLSGQEISKRSGIHPFVIKKIIHNIDRFNIESIIKTYDKLSATDINFKNGRFDLKDALFNLVLFQKA